MSKVSELIAKFDEQVEIYNANKDLVENNKAAGARLRKATSEMTKLGKELRKETVALFK